MAPSGNLPELHIPEPVGVDAAEISRCVERAAALVGDFVGRCAPAALDRLLDTAGGGRDASLSGTIELARAVLDQTATLEAELERFLELTGHLPTVRR